MADVPSASAQKIRGELYNVLTLVRYVGDQMEDGFPSDEPEGGGLTSPSTRMVCLCTMAEEKLRDCIERLGKFV